MGLFDKVRNMINPDTEGEYGDDEYLYSDDEYDYDGGAAQTQNNQNMGGFTAPQSNNQTRSHSAGMGLNSGALELKVVKPEKYDSTTAQKIADHLLNRRTVVLNLEATNKESARRLIDFLSGVAYSIDGYIQRVANNTFVIVPNNVDVSGEQLQEVKKQEETDFI